MLKLLLVGNDKGALSDLAAALDQHSDVDILWADFGETALRIVSGKIVDLIITDEVLGDMTGLEFADRLIAVNPMVNCATVSSLSPEKFHEASEGLGLMAQLSVKPGKEEAEDLLHRLRHIKGLTGGVKDGVG